MRPRPVLLIVAAVAALLAGCSEGNVFALEQGDCFDLAADVGDAVTDVEVVACSEPHDNEVFATFDLDGDEFPGAPQVQAEATNGCLERFDEFVGLAYAESRYVQSSFFPTEDSWSSDDREVVCFLADVEGEKLTGSAEGTAE